MRILLTDTSIIIKQMCRSSQTLHLTTMFRASQSLMGTLLTTKKHCRVKSHVFCIHHKRMPETLRVRHHTDVNTSQKTHAPRSSGDEVLGPSRELNLLPPVARARLNVVTFTFRELGRSHSVNTRRNGSVRVWCVRALCAVHCV